MFCFSSFVVVPVEASLIFMKLLMLSKCGTFVYFLKQGIWPPVSWKYSVPRHLQPQCAYESPGDLATTQNLTQWGWNGG